MGRLAACMLVTLAACKAAPEAPAASTPAASASSAGDARVVRAAVPREAARPCQLEPKGGLDVPASARSQDVRIALSNGKALLTWLGPVRADGGGRAAHGRVYDAVAHTLGNELALQESSYGDVIPSGEAPVTTPGGVESVSCVNSAPEGKLYCTRTALGQKGTSLFVANFGNAGPQAPGIAAVAKGGDTLLFLPEGGSGDVAVFASTAASKKARSRTFAADYSSTGKHADSLSAALVLPGATEAVVAYRFRDSIRVRRAGWDEKWIGAPLTVSTKGMQVGAPAIVQDSKALHVFFAERASAKTEWRLVHARVVGTEVTRTPLELGPGDHTGATAIAVPSSFEGCLRLGWVEGKGKDTVTKIAAQCPEVTTLFDPITLSAPGIEGGRAWLAGGDAPEAGQGDEVVAWQEFPKPGQPVLKVASIVCP